MENDFNQPLKSFLLLALFLIILATAAFFLLITILHNLIVREIIILILMMIIFVFGILLIIASISAAIIYHTSHIDKRLVFLAKWTFDFLMPLFIYFSTVFQSYNSRILLFYIRMNNIIVKSHNLKYAPEDILILLPHCLQYAGCAYKVTNFIDNCHKCYRCNIGNIKELAETYKLSVEIVTGGAAARSAVLKVKPKLIIAIACERDLASGIADIRFIPVIGILNKRPNGPCYNTGIDIEELSEIVASVISRCAHK